MNQDTATAMPPASMADDVAASPNLVASRLSRAIDRVLGLILCAVVALNFVSAASRYVGGRAIVGADEIQVYAVVWLVFLGGAIVSWRRMHLRMDVLSSRLTGPAAKARALLEALLSTAVCGVMSWVSLQFVLQIHEMGQHSDGAGIPMWIPHSAVLVGFVLTTIASAHELLMGLRTLSR